MPQYEHAVALAGGEPVRIPLDRSAAEVTALLKTCDAVLLPGSPADVDPAKFKQTRVRETAAADPRREEVDSLLLDDAYAQRKPVLGICYGLQSLNVYRQGSLVQHIPDFLPPEWKGMVNHEAGKLVSIAHSVEIEAGSKLAEIIAANREGVSRRDRNWVYAPTGRRDIALLVNSSHHQSADAIGQGLRAVARCTEDGIVEAIEGTNADHFVIAIQWHPERSVENDAPSRSLFRALIEAAG